MEEKSCLKCGRPCSEDQSFCGECLAEMTKYPVKPGVVVLLPRQDRTPRPTPRRRYAAPDPEEQLEKLKKQVIALWLALILALSAAGVLGWHVLSDYMEQQANKLLPGQNYSSETTGQPIEMD